MTRIIIATYLLCLTACSSLPNSINNGLATQPHDGLIDWSSKTGINRFANSQVKGDFFRLANHFESQTNKVFCGPTSATIVLNTLRVNNPDFELPSDRSLLREDDWKLMPKHSKFSPIYKRYTQNTVLDKSPKVRASILGKPTILANGENIKDPGLQLQQLANLLLAHGLQVNKYVVADNTNSQHLIKMMINALATTETYVIANYHRKSVNQVGGGHISPIAAYDKQSDSFLVLDTAPNKANWAWIGSMTLLSAMRTFDKHENRGFLVIKESINH